MDKHIRNNARRLEQDFGWEQKCAETFAAFLSITDENRTNCYPENYPLWCEFVVAAHRIKRNQRPTDTDLEIVLQQVAGWLHNGDSIIQLKSDYLKGLVLLDYIKYNND